MSEIIDPAVNPADTTPEQPNPTAEAPVPPTVDAPANDSAEAAPEAASASEPVPADTSPKVAPLPAGSRRAKRAQGTKNPLTPPNKTEKGGRKKNYRLVTAMSTLRSMVIVFAVAVIVGTIFTSFTANDSLSPTTQNNLAIVQVTEERRGLEATTLPTPAWFHRIGIVAGHSGIAKRGPTTGNVDPGTVCPDGFTEASVTMKVATQVVAALHGRGFDVDLLEEFDPKLAPDAPTYEAATFLSIHADSCASFNDGYPHSGFAITNPTLRTTVRDQDLRLVDCIRDHYSQATGLKFSGWTITENMFNYHAFREISQRTPAAIIELGLMYYDRDALEHHPDKSAQGIINGILCYLDPAALATATTPPTSLPKLSVSAPPTGRVSATLPPQKPTLSTPPR